MPSANVVAWFLDRSTGEQFVADVREHGGPQLTLVPTGQERVTWEVVAAPADFERAMQIKEELTKR